jgi:uncharacterized damage-inducible protein DinB
MKPMQPEQASFLLQTILPSLKNEHRSTKAVLQAIPVDKADYRPDSCARSAMELARHIAASENRFLETVVNGVFNTNSPTIPESVKNSADLTAWYAQEFEKNVDALTKATPEQLVKIVDFRGMFQWPAVSFLQLALFHSIHHRGQLSTYLRPMGGKVPAIYGESYDSAQAKKATQSA